MGQKQSIAPVVETNVELSQQTQVSIALAAIFGLLIIFLMTSFRSERSSEEKEQYKNTDVQFNASLDDEKSVKSFIESLRKSIPVRVGSSSEPVSVNILIDNVNALTYRRSSDTPDSPLPQESYPLVDIVSCRIVSDTKDSATKVLLVFKGDRKVLLMPETQTQEELVRLAEGFGSLVLAASCEPTKLTTLLDVPIKRESPLKSTMDTLTMIGNVAIVQPFESFKQLFDAPDSSAATTAVLDETAAAPSDCMQK